MAESKNEIKLGTRERELIRLLELYKRQGVPLTPTVFCKKVGLAGTSSIKRYKVLKSMLNEYSWQTNAEKMRGHRGHQATVEIEHLDDPRVERLEAKILRLEDALKAAGDVKGELSRCRTQLQQVRGVLMALVAEITGASPGRAQEVEARLLELAWAHASVCEPTGDGGVREYGTTTEFLDDIQKNWRAE